MSREKETEFDIVAECLIKINRKQKVSKDELVKATQKYNDVVRELNNFREKSHQTSLGQGHAQVPDTDQGKTSRAVENLRDENKRLAEDNANLQRQTGELKIRLSSIAGQKMTHGNPNIADLSDPYRPTNLAEKFKLLYDDDWTHSYEILDQTRSVEEERIIDFLADIIKEVDKFCSNTSRAQRSKIQHYMMNDLVSPKVELPDGKGTKVARVKGEVDEGRREIASRLLTDFQKSLGRLSVEPLEEIFKDEFLKSLREKWRIGDASKEINNYVAKGIEIVWMMKIQQPPMEFAWKSRDENCDKNRFVFYTRRGERVKQTVWPAVLLHADGPLVAKGVVQAL